MNVLFRPIGREYDELVVLSSELRTYAALSSKGDRFHLLQPAIVLDPRVGDGKRLVGELVCSCEAGILGRRCWATTFAERFEAGEIGRTTALTASLPIPDEDIEWLRPDAAAIPEVASR